MTLLSPSKFLLLASLACSAPSTTALADVEKTFPDSNFAITLPNSWTDFKSHTTTPNMVMMYGDPSRKRTTTVLVDRQGFQSNEWGTVGAFAFEKTLELSTHGTKLSGRFMTVQGIKSYEFSEVTHPQGKDVYILVRAIPVRGAVYMVQAMRFNGGKVEDDPEILRILDSFRFIKQPESLPSEKETILKYSQFINRSVLPVAVIIAIIVIAVVRSRSSPPRQPPSPPPLPPPPLPR